MISLRLKSMRLLYKSEISAQNEIEIILRYNQHDEIYSVEYFLKKKSVFIAQFKLY